MGPFKIAEDSPWTKLRQFASELEHLWLVAAASALLSALALFPSIRLGANDRRAE